MEATERKIVTLTTADGRTPFEEWLKGLKDKRSKAKILNRIDRLRLGNFGDCKSVGNGIYELRIHFGPGFRVYFGLHSNEMVVLLVGGDKSSQRKNIETATQYWKEYKENEN